MGRGLDVCGLGPGLLLRRGWPGRARPTGAGAVAGGGGAAACCPGWCLGCGHPHPTLSRQRERALDGGVRG